MAIRSSPFLRKVVEAGEAQVDRLVSQLLGNDRFVASVQSVVSRTLDAKGTLDKRIRAGLATMNLPSTHDIDDLRQLLDEVGRSVGELAGKVEGLERAMAAQKPPAKATTARTQGKVASVAKPKAAGVQAKARPSKAGGAKAAGASARVKSKADAGVAAKGKTPAPKSTEGS